MTNSPLPKDKPLDAGYESMIREVFSNPDLTLIKSVIYFDSWNGFEEYGGLLIFRGIDNSIQSLEFGYSVMGEDNTNYFRPNEVSLDEAISEIAQMEEIIRTNTENTDF
jgi:hypothetical protein